MLGITVFFSAIALGLLSVGLFWRSWRPRARRWMFRGCLVTGVFATVLFVVFAAGNVYWAGQGDAPQYAREWVAKWQPLDATNTMIDCQVRDFDASGTISCTVGWEIDGFRQIQAIECGVNRFLRGWGHVGCQLAPQRK